MTTHEEPTRLEREAMTRALTLAERGPSAGRNPRVGCVLLGADGTVIAEGYHRGAGHPHAEVEALSDARKRGVSPVGATAVVTLEPCNHEGLTGPCSRALIEAGVARVVFAASDPGAESAGGSDTLRAAGVEVLGGVDAEQSEALNAHWFFAMRHQRPFVTAKWAQSLDGRHAAPDQTSQWITGEASRIRVHRERSEHGAIMVGTTTALVDDPSLTARDGDGLYAEQPLAVVVGMRDLPETARVRSHPGGFVQIREHDPHLVLRELFEAGVRSVYLEGGATLVSSFIQHNLVDEFHITMGPMLIGGNQLAIGDIGVTTLDQALRLSVAEVDIYHSDVWVVAHPAREQ